MDILRYRSALYYVYTISLRHLIGYSAGTVVSCGRLPPSRSSALTWMLPHSISCCEALDVGCSSLRTLNALNELRWGLRMGSSSGIPLRDQSSRSWLQKQAP